MIRCRKHPILLLEIMIAIALIAMAVIPLIYPQIYLLRTQRYFMNKVELDHFVNLHYVDLLERLYNNNVSLATIFNQLEFPINQDDLTTSESEQPLPFKGSYRLSVRIFKPKGEEWAALRLYLLNLDYVFHPADQSPSEKNQLKYHYDLFVVRDLTEGKLPEGSDEDLQETLEEESLL